MNRDPLHRKIVEALAGPLDGESFQRCAVALIGKAHPNLAPRPGGNDAGMDGAFETPDGPYPLICTVRSDVIGNFRENVSTYHAKRSGPKMGRFVQPEILIGRDEDLAWLRQVHGDSLVVGHPGSGKTYLHQYLATEGFCLFTVDDSLERLADAIRDQQPSVIVHEGRHSGRIVRHGAMEKVVVEADYLPIAYVRHCPNCNASSPASNTPT